MSEIFAFAQLLLPVAAGLALVILSTRVSARFPILASGLFLLTAAAASAIWPDTLSVRTVERIGVVALVVILLNGGMDIGWSRMRESLRPVVSPGAIGTFLPAALVTAVAHFAWRRGACSTRPQSSVQMAVGLTAGFLAARVVIPLVGRVRLGSEELRPVLAVLVLGLFLGDSGLLEKRAVEELHHSLAGPAEIVVFLARGLTVDLTTLPADAWRDGALLTIALALAIRPAVAAVTLARAQLQAGERVFIAWSGLKGAVP